MQEKIKDILGIYLKIPADQITAATIIDRSVLGSSILVHRMYAKLAAENIIVGNYQQVRSVGDLLQHIEKSSDSTNTSKISGDASEAAASAAAVLPVIVKENTGVGIDIEMVAGMPVTEDFREDPFYTMNFSAAEISYCILQPKPYVSFAGLFAAKEAIVKADNAFKKTEFKNIVILHLPGGKPFHAGFDISVSHTDEIAVAVAMPVQPGHTTVKEIEAGTAIKTAGSMPALAWLLLLTSFLLSAIALFLISKRG